MPQLAPAERPGNPLAARLGALRRRLRLVAAARGLGWLLAVVLGAAAAAGLLDWLVHLPSLVRAVLLVGTLTGAGLVACRYLVRPLAAQADDLALALRVEERYPSLNDALASTVQFLQQPAEAARLDSPALRREAVRRALARARGCDFGQVIDRRGLRAAGLSGFAACGLALALVLLQPAAAGTALARLAHPFGGVEWPPQTQIEITTTKQRIGKDEPFEITAVVRGVVPARATVNLHFDGAAPEEYGVNVARDGDVGQVAAKLERGRAQRSFRFRVKANDAVTPWQAVAVVPPPTLVALAGRASPQVRLDYPAYADLPPQDRPDGSGDVVAVAGTEVTLRAAADRPLAKAWVEYQPDLEQTELVPFLRAFAKRVPVRLDESRRLLEVRFRPNFWGRYALHFEDDTGLRNSRYYDVHVSPDPAPEVKVKRPRPDGPGPRLLPGAAFDLEAEASDPTFAVRSVYLEYRTRKDDPPRRLPLYDAAYAQLLSGLAAAPGGGPPLPLRPRQGLVAVEVPLSLKQFRHRDGLALRPGDVLVLRVCADDFDDVTPDKRPGRGDDVEIKVIDQNELDLLLNQEQARVQQELVILRNLQREAKKLVGRARDNLAEHGQLDQKDRDALAQAEEELQRKVRERVGNRQEGLRAEVDRIREMLRQNRQPRSLIDERVEEVEAELERLSREELGQVEPHLSTARKQQESAGDARAKEKALEHLDEALLHQDEVEKTLEALLSRLEPWSSTQEHKAEAKTILQEQRQLERDTDGLKGEGVGDKLDQLTPEQRRRLQKLADAQKDLHDRLSRLLGKMQGVAEQKKDSDPQTAEAMREAAAQGRKDNIPGKMEDARRALEQNKLSSAAGSQRQAVERLEKMVKALEERRELELDRLADRLQKADRQLQELAEAQRRLQEEIDRAGREPDPKKREEALKRLAPRQRELQKKAEEAQEALRQLSRRRAEEAAQRLGDAQARMEQNAQRLEQGKAPEGDPEEALDRLDEARRELQRARGDAEEELTREQVAKIADQVRGLKERHEALVAEAERLRREAGQLNPRVLRANLRDLARNQGNDHDEETGKDVRTGLAEETARLAEKLGAAKVFARNLQKAAEAMQEAGKRFGRPRPNADAPALDPEAPRLQQEALVRLEQVLGALKPEPGVPQRQAKPDGEPGGGQGQSGRRGDGDAIPDLAQLKLLRAMQAEVERLTKEFDRRHPDADRLTPADKAELQGLRRRQQEVVELLEEVTRPAGVEGGKP